MTHSKGEKFTNLYPFESKGYSAGKKLFGLDWKNVIYRPLFALCNSLLAAMIFMFMKKNLINSTRKKPQRKSIGKWPFCLIWKDTI